jgi:hypothetical protein
VTTCVSAEVFLPANLFLQGDQFGQVAHQAQGAADFHFGGLRRRQVGERPERGAHRSVYGRYRHSKVADFALRSHVLDFAALKCLSVPNAGCQHVR